MPIIRKIIPIGKTSRAIIIPKSWLQFFEQATGQPIEKVAIEINHALKITPILEDEKVIDENARRRFDAIINPQPKINLN